MATAPTTEQEAIRSTLRALLTAECATDRVRAAVLTPDGHDRDLWQRLSADIGLPGLTLPTALGGAGCGPAEAAPAYEETGRALLPSPLLATAGLAAPLIDALGTPAQRTELLPRAAAGTLVCALALPGGSLPTALGLTCDNAAVEWSGGGRCGGVRARPAPDGGWLLYGEAERVLAGHSAGLLLVAARAGGYPRGRTLLFLVPGDAPGLTRTRLTALDETRPQARVELRDTPAALLGPETGPETGTDTDTGTADVLGALTDVGARAAVLVAAESAGTAAAALERTVAHVRVREQFGRPIGSFQAVRHRLADLYVQVRAARSAAHHAAGEPADAGALALAQCLEAVRAVTAEAVQLHGGIGFTWEHDAHLYFKRAAGDELLFGPVHRLRAHAAERSGLFTPQAHEEHERNDETRRTEATVR
ncbi:acyl-CoA dehydrogenase family protein [Streptomyces yaizuensis]|uniref:Acyl-CoA/acyl-ACP dehydrogenase n=1 Tax=Streptomyces yaizuensis TaxID=2989713 RepID=A0ABQ5P4Y4_9ACTN|nr:acyl-CoA dehydrogenase family protein [Streptomyces sp. YSPA8]GLF97326.1 acyl-CoA/acyl-ACP dehydrogenase [Streptomyces sp. YSPA8]